MVIEEFSNRVLASKIIDTYVATAFFATVVFFVLNSHAYTAIEMLFGVMIVTIAFKGLSHLMVALVIALFNLDNKKDELEFDNQVSRIDGLLNDLALQQTKIKTQGDEG